MNKLTRQRNKELGLGELIAIALGGMVGGGIFSILGIATENIGNATPYAILIGGVLALCAAYSYVKLALLYKDEGATYSFFKKSFPNSELASSVIGWLIVFGYISTLALYAFTFASYFCSQFDTLNHPIWQKIIAGLIITFFAIINLVSVKGMGKLEDILVYSKIVILLFISGLLAGKGDIQNLIPVFENQTTLTQILIVSAITFVAYEGFQLVIHASNEMDNPQKNIPRAIYSSIVIATLLYVILSIAALSAIPKEIIIADKEYALAAGTKTYLGQFGQFIVIFGALLATSSAISGTLFGASRLMAVIANDGYFPKQLGQKIKTHIPNKAIITMSVFAYVLLATGGLQVILEFGSITFIIVSMLMAYTNYRKRVETNSSLIITATSFLGLLLAGLLIIYFEFTENKEQFIYIIIIYILLGIGAFFYSKKKTNAQQRA
ncbi:amino acid permease [Tenacibaculum discolor]|uniref:APC family permease n=1 Tax=Tenacibaculum discolor TaxID=361581 RepID=A0A2G1BVJ3_9FLAO|nr:APC family permease [Tenacibaculum discolor]MDP2541960.1 APC family permease [Tenacibaculum discolor]PHN97625.1 amino acid permease [Tenacibaculum discolor]PHN99382.1 amino acid permease [Rhodobacteraceae bacterium 4F10]